MDNELLNIHEAAEFLGRKHQALRRLIARGILPAYLEGKAYVIKRSDLERIKDEQYPEGMTHSDIAREYDVNRTTVIAQFKRLKVQPWARGRGKVQSNVYSQTTVSKFAQILGWDRRRKNPTHE